MLASSVNLTGYRSFAVERRAQLEGAGVLSILSLADGLAQLALFLLSCYVRLYGARQFLNLF